VNIVGEPYELFELRRRDDDNTVLLGCDASKQRVDFGLGADVDPLSRLLDQEYTGIALKRARNCDLLLIAAAECANANLRIRRPNTEAIDVLLRHGALFARPTKPEATHRPANPVAEAKIRADRERGNDRGSSAIRRNQQDTLLDRMPYRSQGQSMTIKKNIAIACGIYTRNRTKKVTMARALDSGDTDYPA